MSLVGNPEETLNFFESLRDGKRSRSLFIDLSEVEQVTVSEVIYLLACLADLEHARTWRHISGNTPRNAIPRQIFSASGFLKYVRGPAHTESTDFVAVRSGACVDTAAALGIVRFVRSKLGFEQKRTEGIYKVLVECMTNTRHHAYAETTSRLAKWWLIAAHSATSGSVEFAFLDTGRGIPDTIHRKLARLNLLKSDLLKSDADLIVSGLRGEELRSRTQKKHRGKGLPQIRSVATRGEIAALTIISRTAHVDCCSLAGRTLKSKFRGTLLQWSIQSESQRGEEGTAYNDNNHQHCS